MVRSLLTSWRGPDADRAVGVDADDARSVTAVPGAEHAHVVAIELQTADETIVAVSRTSATPSTSAMTRVQSSELLLRPGVRHHRVERVRSPVECDTPMCMMLACESIWKRWPRTRAQRTSSISWQSSPKHSIASRRRDSCSSPRGSFGDRRSRRRGGSRDECYSPRSD